MKPLSTVAYIPPAEQSMRSSALGRQRDWARAAKELDRVLTASPPATPATSKRYITAEEAVADLGLEPEVKAVVAKEVRALVSEQRTGFEVAKTLREQGLRQPVVRELLARGMRMVAEMRAARSVSDLFLKKGGSPPGAGWEPIPTGKKGGFRRHRPGGGYEYAYPDADGGYTSHESPAADEGLGVHEEHENGTPEPKVRARMEQLEAKAKAAGLGFTARATARTTMKHLNELEKQLDRAIAQKQKAGQTPKPPVPSADDVFATPGDGGERAPGQKGDNPPEPAPEEPKPEPSQKQRREQRIRDLGAEKGVSSDQLAQLLADPDFQTEEGQHALIEHMESLPDLKPVETIPDEVPESPAERKKLEDHAARLEETIAKMERALAVEREHHAKELDQLREEVKRLAARPTPRAAAQTSHAVWVFALLTFGFAAGFLFAGPMGALLGSSMANSYLRTGVAKGGEPYRPLPLSPGLWLVGGSGLILVKAMQHPAGSGWTSIPGGKKGGYRRPKAGGGWEYWYSDPDEHAAHHDAKAAEHGKYAAYAREVAERPGTKRQSLLESADKQDAKAAEHAAQAEHARGAARGVRLHDTRPGVKPNAAHAGKRTLGPDEGKVWSTIADLFNGVEADKDGNVYLSYATAIEPESVSVKAADGRLHIIKVSVSVGDSFGGHLSSRAVPGLREDGTLDHENLVQKPHAIVINVPAGLRNRDMVVEEARRTLAHELAHAMDNLTGAHARRDRQAYDEHGDAYYNDPTEIVAYRHNIFRELNDPRVAAQVKSFRDTMTDDSPELRAEARQAHREMREEGDDLAGLGYTGKPHLSAHNVINFLERHSATWAQVSPHLTPANRRKMLVAASAVLHAHHEDTSEPAAKALSVPQTLPGSAPRIRARHGENSYGHRDGLVPGQILTVRKGAPGPAHVEVLPGGRFRWGDNDYVNGRQLLKALTGNDAHKMTVRRYFGLGTEDARLAKAMASAVRAKYPGLLVAAFEGRVRVEGDLRRFGIAPDQEGATTALLDLSTVQNLLAEST